MKNLILELNQELTKRIRLDYGRAAGKIHEIREQTKEAAVKDVKEKKAPLQTGKAIAEPEITKGNTIIENRNNNNWNNIC